MESRVCVLIWAYCLTDEAGREIERGVEHDEDILVLETADGASVVDDLVEYLREEDYTFAVEDYSRLGLWFTPLPFCAINGVERHGEYHGCLVLGGCAVDEIAAIFQQLTQGAK